MTVICPDFVHLEGLGSCVGNSKYKRRKRNAARPRFSSAVKNHSFLFLTKQFQAERLQPPRAHLFLLQPRLMSSISHEERNRKYSIGFNPRRSFIPAAGLAGLPCRIDTSAITLTGTGSAPEHRDQIKSVGTKTGPVFFVCRNLPSASGSSVLALLPLRTGIPDRGSLGYLTSGSQRLL